MVQSKKNTQDTVKYPCLMEGKSGNVYLMRDNLNGTVVWLSPDSRFVIGETVVFATPDKLTVYKGTITLSNQSMDT